MERLRDQQEIQWVFQAAMVGYLVTIGLGMSHGLRIIDFSNRNQAQTHLHAGTIGWITLGILAPVPWVPLGGSMFHRGEAVRFRCLSGTTSDELAAARRTG